jgi:hypothetical protein
MTKRPASQCISKLHVVRVAPELETRYGNAVKEVAYDCCVSARQTHIEHGPERVGSQKVAFGKKLWQPLPGRRDAG